MPPYGIHWWDESIEGSSNPQVKISYQYYRLKHLNFQYIYLISYKIAKKANPVKWICPY